MYWFEDPQICAQLPIPLKCYSAYCARMLDRTSGRVMGGSFLLRSLQRYRGLWGGLSHHPIKVGNVVMMIDPYSEAASFGLNEIIATSDELRVMRLALSKGDTFLDVGANHGAFSLMACGIVGPQGSVVAFEPQPELATSLRKSFLASGFTNAEVQQAAVSDHEGAATFYIPAHSGMAGVHRNFSAQGAYQEIRVPLVTLDERIKVLHAPGKLFIKLDVEGSELAFLRGAESTLRERRPHILMEINPESATAADYEIADVIGKLKELGYERFSEMAEYPRSLSFSELSDGRLQRFHDIVVVP